MPTSEIKKLMIDLVKIESVTASPDGEMQCALFIHDWLAKVEYFKRNANFLSKIEIKGKNYFAISALVRAANPTNRTVIITGHFDVVDAEDCGAIKAWAYDPEEYTKRMSGMKINDEARADLESGRYIFGRGVADMKLGIAIEMCLIKDFSENPGMFDVNILFLAVPDEEGDSFGMRAAIEPLLDMQSNLNEGLDFAVCLNTEPSFVEGEHKNSPAVYHGTIGKMMPFFLCVGKEAHVGNYRDGLNSLLIASYLNTLFEGGDREIACLYMRDTRKSYAVTLPERTAMYFNYLSTDDTPAGIMINMKDTARKALCRTFAHLGVEGKYEPRVITVNELIHLAASAESVSESSLLDKLAEELAIKNFSNERDRNIEAVLRLLDISAQKGPLVVAGFLPPFYPSRENKSGEKCGRIEKAISELEIYTREKYGLPIVRAGIMNGITDLSFTGFDGDPSELNPLAENIPLWGRGYEISLEALSKIDIPVMNFGPIGKDCHKLTERADMEYSTKILPDLLKHLISKI